MLRFLRPEPEHPIYPLPCRRCGQPVGETDGDALIIGNARFSRPVTLTCRGCGAGQTWRPGPSKATVAAYSDRPPLLQE
jgi:hypothetical protein